MTICILSINYFYSHLVLNPSDILHSIQILSLKQKKTWTHVSHTFIHILKKHCIYNTTTKEYIFLNKVFSSGNVKFISFWVVKRTTSTTTMTNGRQALDLTQFHFHHWSRTITAAYRPYSKSLCVLCVCLGIVCLMNSTMSVLNEKQKSQVVCAHWHWPF